MEQAGLYDQAAFPTVKRQIVRVYLEADRARLVRRQANAPESLELLHGTGDARDEVARIELHHLLRLDVSVVTYIHTDRQSVAKRNLAGTHAKVLVAKPRVRQPVPEREQRRKAGIEVKRAHTQ